MTDFMSRRNLQGQVQKLMGKHLTDINFQIKIADLGYARELTHGEFANSACGTPLLVAPELLLKRVYDHKIDVWGIANIFYTLITGKLLFDGKSQSYTKQLEEGVWKFPCEVNISAEALKFLHDLLQFDPNKRLSINQLDSHPYLNVPLEKL